MDPRPRPAPSPRLPADTVLTRTELASLLRLDVHQVPKVLVEPFSAHPDAIPARVALGLMVLQLLGEQNDLQPEHAVAVASGAMTADPEKTRRLAAGWNQGECGAAWVTPEVIAECNTPAQLSDAFKTIDFVRHNGAELLPADVFFFDLLTRIAVMRAGQAQP